MPIPGITDTDRLPRLGHIRLGEKVEGRNGDYPKALDYFRFDDAPGVAIRCGARSPGSPRSARTSRPMRFRTWPRPA